jgi:sensor domain CHASE-containing protein
LAIASQDLDLFNEEGWQSNQLATVIESVMAQFRHTFRRWIIWHA